MALHYLKKKEKNEHPNIFVYLTEMIEVSMKLFSPILDSSAYAHYVFNTFDHDRNGSLSFEVSLIFCFELY